MRTNILWNVLAATATAACALACSDTWDDHYEVAAEGGDKSLLTLMEEAGDMNDFLSVLRATHVFNNNRISSVTFDELVAGDRSLTVWAPTDGSFNVDSLLLECQTTVGDSMCGVHFVQNHIANYVTNCNNDAVRVLMLNDKYLTQENGALHGTDIIASRANMPAKNGLLHALDGKVDYIYNVYEGITSLEDYAHIGNFIKQYDKLELDEEESVQCGIEDGMIVYSDSVMEHTNIFFNLFDRINDEDSSFIMLMPDATTWEKVYAEAKSHYNYGAVSKADSLSEYYTHVALIQDLVYNRNIGCQHMADSVYSTSYDPSDEERHHVYYRPLDAGGIFSSTYVQDSLECSNGVIYELAAWPFEAEDIYLFPVKTEAEIESMLTDYDDCSYNYRSVVADSVSDGYIDIQASSSSANWTAKFQIPSVLSGTYELCAVILPKTVYNVNSRDFKPNKFVATLTYETEDGTTMTESFSDERTNDPYRVDTVSIGTFTIPVTSYGQQNAKVYLEMECSISRRETSYSREMYLDCLYFKPIKDEED